MREIKFRVWDEEEKTMWRHENIGYINFYDKVIWLRHGGFLDMDYNPCTLMQYTGLKDKNGKEIYEGDIVSLFYETQISEVRFNSKYGCWEVKVQLSIHSQGWDLLGNHLGESEVIGNIYENPELLEVEEC